MDKIQFKSTLNKLLTDNGYKVKSSSWYKYSDDITKIICLDKSKYGNKFYINYGLIINKIDLDGLRMHIHYGLGSKNENENRVIINVMDLEFPMDDTERAKLINDFVLTIILKRLNAINTEDDIRNELLRRNHLNDIPLVVKELFNLTP